MERARQLWAGDRGRLAHLLVAAALGIFLVAETAVLDTDRKALLVVLAVGAASLLLFTRRWPLSAPLVVLTILAAMATAEDVIGSDTTGPFVTVLFCSWTIGANNAKRQALIGLAVAELLVLWVNVQLEETVGDYFWTLVFVGIAWLAGFVVNRRSAHARDLAEQTARLEADRITAAERAVAEERQRIARELHDVVAHSVSVMTVQAGAVRRLLRPDQERERLALETVETTGREALTEMRRLVGLLRKQGTMPEFAPQPSMRAVDVLVGTVREAGLPVELAVEGNPQELPPGVDLSAYRVIQEALTNALKYAGPANAWVTVRWKERELELEIANDGRSEPGDGDSGGHGLAGLRERVSLVGGSLESGPRNGGGFVVKAHLPLGGRA